MSKKYRVAVVGATGAVGREMIRTLIQRKFPFSEIVALASERSNGKRIKISGKEYKVKTLTEKSFEGVDIALFSAGASRSVDFAPHAVKSGAIVIDNSSAFRMKSDVPLIVPEVNSYAIKEHKGIIANPNCSTIQMVVVLKPIHKVANIRRVVVSTYQAVSGAGQDGMQELRLQMENIVNHKSVGTPKKFPRQIAYNLIPHIDIFLDNDYTKEEMKMINETHKIMDDNSIKVCPTAVRVPVLNCHSESVNIQLEQPLSAEECRNILKQSPGIKVVDSTKKQLYPTPFECSGTDDVFVGRIREDDTVENGLNLWIVADNLRKGAALNAVQIAEELVKQKLV